MSTPEEVTTPEPEEEEAPSERPEPTPDCCKVWPTFARRFEWMTFTEWPDLACMPFVWGVGRDEESQEEEFQQWRVQFCPACGAKRRSTVMPVARLAPYQP